MDLLYIYVLIQYHCCHGVLVFTLLGVKSLLHGILSIVLLLIVLFTLHNFRNKEVIIVTIQCLVYPLETNKYFIKTKLHQKAVVQIFTVYFDIMIN